MSNSNSSASIAQNGLLAAVLSKVKFPCYFDEGSGFILDQDGKMICEIRGWGWIQKLGADAEAMQDEFGRKICELINGMSHGG
jgi:hypothetical protein